MKNNNNWSIENCIGIKDHISKDSNAVEIIEQTNVTTKNSAK